MRRPKSIGKVESVEKKWLSRQEAMAYLGCSGDFLASLRDKNEISFAQYGHKATWYELRSIERFIERNRVV